MIDMTEKRFINVNHEIWQGNDVWCVAGGEHCADVIATALNELIKENEQLKSLNIPIEEIKETVVDYKGRIVGVYYND